jgi:hypothetical protein
MSESHFGDCGRKEQVALKLFWKGQKLTIDCLNLLYKGDKDMLEKLTN